MIIFAFGGFLVCILSDIDINKLTRSKKCQLLVDRVKFVIWNSESYFKSIQMEFYANPLYPKLLIMYWQYWLVTGQLHHS